MSHQKNTEIRKRTKGFNTKNRPRGIVVEASDFSDFESSGSNTMSSTASWLNPSSGIRKSHSSVEGLKSMSTQEEALATLDGFLNEVEKAVEEAKEDEKQKLASKPKLHSKDYTHEQRPLVMRRSSSFPNVLNELPGNELRDGRKDIPKSTSELDKDDSAEIPRFHNKEKKNSSKTTEISDLQHLTSLYKLVEHLENLQTKKETPSAAKKTQEAVEDVVDAPAQTNPKVNKTHKKLSHVHKEKKPNKLKIKSSGSHQAKYSLGKPKYHEIITRKFMSKTKSLENIKAALQNEKRSEHKLHESKMNYLQPYASDDLTITNDKSEMKWKSSSGKVNEKTKSSSLSRADATNDLTQGFVPKEELEIIPKKINEVNEPPSVEEDNLSSMNVQSPIRLEKFFDNTESAYEDVTLVNHSILKSTEWLQLQKAFPLPQPTTSEDLWAEFVNHKNGHRRKGTSPHKRRRSWFLPKLEKKRGTNMFLPSADLAGFNENLMAAQMLSDQLTLSLDMNTLENTLSAHSDNSSLLSPSDFSFNESLQVI